MEIRILVKSSSQPEHRTVHVTNDESGLSFYCECPAGERGRICKHKKALALGDDEMLFADDQTENFKTIMEQITQSEYPELIKELEESETELEKARNKAKFTKDKIARVMKEGLV